MSKVKYFLLIAVIEACKHGGQTDSDAQSLTVDSLLMAYDFVNDASEIVKSTEESGIIDLELPVVEGIKAASGMQRFARAGKTASITRIDRLKLAGLATPGRFIAQNLPIGFSIADQTEFLFARPFLDLESAKKAPSFTADNLPLTPELAIALTPGSFVSLPAKLNLLMNGNLNTSTIGSALGPAQLTANYMVNITGDFNLYFIRETDQKIRVQLISQKSRDSDLTGSLQIAPFQVQVLKLANGYIQSLISNSVTIGLTDHLEDDFLIEYEFDLAEQTARNAYNELLNPRKVFKTYRKTDPLELVSDLTSLQGIKGVELGFKSQRYFSKQEKSLKFRILGGSFKTSSSESDEILTYATDKQNKELRYYSMDSSQERKSWVPIFRAIKNIQTFALLDITGRGRSPLVPIETSGVNLEFTQETLSKGEVDKLFTQLSDELPTAAFEDLERHRPEIKYGNEYRHVKIAMQLYYKSSLMQNFLEIKNEADFLKIRDQVWENIKGIPGSDRIIAGENTLQMGIATSLVNAVSPNFDYYGALDGTRKALDFLALRGDPTVKKIGFSAILKAVFGEENINNGMYYTFWWSAINPSGQEENVSLTAGTDSNKDLYESLKFAQNLFSGAESKLEFYFP